MGRECSLFVPLAAIFLLTLAVGSRPAVGEGPDTATLTRLAAGTWKFPRRVVQLRIDGSVDDRKSTWEVTDASARKVRIRFSGGPEVLAILSEDVMSLDGRTESDDRFFGMRLTASPLLTRADGPTVVFADSDFADRTFSVRSQTRGGAGTMDYGREEDPERGGWFRVTHRVNPAPEGEVTWIIGFHQYWSRVYDPFLHGAVRAVDYEEWTRLVEGRPQEAALAVLQEGRVYAAGLRGDRLPEMTDSPVWRRTAGTGLTADDFVFVDGLVVDRDRHPDFTAAGGPLGFGFLRQNRAGSEDPAHVATSGIDDWKVTIHRESPGGGVTPRGGAALDRFVRGKVLSAFVEPDREDRIAVGDLTITIPAGAVPERRTLEVFEVDPAVAEEMPTTRRLAGPVYRIEMEGELAVPARLSMPVRALAEPVEGIEPVVVLLVPAVSRDTGAECLIAIAADSTWDRERGLVHADVRHFSTWTISWTGSWGYAKNEDFSVRTPWTWVPKDRGHQKLVQDVERGTAEFALKDATWAREQIVSVFGLDPSYSWKRDQVMRLSKTAADWIIGESKALQIRLVTENKEDKKATSGGFKPSSLNRNWGYIELDRALGAKEQKATLLHEYFHYVQDLYRPGLITGEYDWIGEASSSVAEWRLVLGKAPTNTDRNSRFFRTALGTNTENHGYGAAIFLNWIVEQTSPRLLGDIYREIAAQSTGSRDAWKAFEAAVEKALPGVGMPTLWERFCLDILSKPEKVGMDLSRTRHSDITRLGKDPVTLRTELDGFSAEIFVVGRDKKLPATGPFESVTVSATGTREDYSIHVLHLPAMNETDLIRDFRFPSTGKGSFERPIPLKNDTMGYLIVLLVGKGNGAKGDVTVTLIPKLDPNPRPDLPKPSAFYAKLVDLPRPAGYGQWGGPHLQRRNDEFQQVHTPGYEDVWFRGATAEYSMIWRGRDDAGRTVAGSKPNVYLTLRITAVNDVKRYRDWSEKSYPGGWKQSNTDSGGFGRRCVVVNGYVVSASVSTPDLADGVVDAVRRLLE